MADRQSTSSVVEELWRRAVEANVGYARAVGRLTSSYVEAVASVAREVGATRMGPTSPAPPPPPTPPRAESRTPRLVLEGATGAGAVGAFVVENGLAQRVETAVVASEFEAPGVGSVSPPLVFEPSKLVLDPGEQTVVRTLVLLDESFAVDADYRGHFAVPGLPGTTVPVTIRRLETDPRE
jgi:hypothetical protein